MDLDTERRQFRQHLEGTLDGLYGTALRLTRNPADAEDLVADAAQRAWVGFSGLLDRQCFAKWIHRILVNAFISDCRHNRAEQAWRELADEGDDGFSLFEKVHQPFLLWWGDPERELLNRLLREDLERALNNLPDKYRTVVVLAEIEGYTYPEIAETLEVPIGTVRSRLSRARAMLQKSLWRQAQDAGLVPPQRGGRDEQARSHPL
jgi:RNA polymerase sigma-70 factor, ECF subfamily